MSKLQKIAAGVAGLSMVLSLASVVSVASAQTMTTTFNTNLTVGSRGADVSALQQALIDGGYLTAVTAPTGYFGAATKAAVSAWQAAVGISPTAGYFGPVSRAYLNTHPVGGTSMTPGCTAGALFSSTTGAPCTTTGGTLPAGCTSTTGYSSTTGTPCSSTTPVVGGVWAPDGSDGSVTLSYVSYAPASQTLKKGDMNKPLISVKLQGVNGKVAVTRFDVHFSERPWLDFGSLNLTDSTGKILATKTLSGASDVTEVTVGSDYLVRFDAISPIVIMPGTDTILAVAGNVLAASDKINNQTVYVGIPSGSIRTINGKGYTDSVGLSSGQGYGVTALTGNSVLLSSTGSQATIYTRISPTTPDQRVQVTSTSNSTPDVTLGVFGLKAQNQSATLNSLSFNINSDTGVATTTLLSNLRLKIGGLTYGSNSLAAGSVTFTNMTIPLAQDQWIDVTLLADINTNQTGVTASSTLVGTSAVGVDANFNSLVTTSASNVTANDVQFLATGSVSISGITSNKGTVTTPTSGTWLAAYPSLGFTVTNNGNSPIYISKVANSALATTTSSGPNASTTVVSTVASGSTTGDTGNAYLINVGATRTFTYNFTVDNTNGTTAAKKISITQINYGTGEAAGTGAGQNAQYNINFGLQNLYVQVP